MPQDHMQVIASLLTLKELMVASRVCTPWRDRISRVAPRSDKIKCDYKSFITLVQSPLTRHITSLILDRCDSYPDGIPFTPFELSAIRPSMTRLQEWTCAILVTGAIKIDYPTMTPSLPLIFPPLKKLDICLSIPNSVEEDDTLYEVWQRLRTWMSAIGNIPTLSQLNLSFEDPSSRYDRHATLPPITCANMPIGILETLLPLREHLLSLDIYGLGSHHEWPSHHLKTLREFTNLTHLDLHRSEWSVRELNELLSGDVPLSKLLDLELCDTIIEEGLEEGLARVKGLKEFNPSQVNVRNPYFLAEYTQLKFCMLECTELVDSDLLVSALSRCTKMKKFRIEHPHMTDVQLESILSHMPELISLNLIKMNSLTRLAFVSKLSNLATKLTTLYLQFCRAIDVAECIHLHSLRSLEKLFLDNSFSSDFDTKMVASFTPGTPEFEAEGRSIWPQLKSFLYDNTWKG